MVDDDAVFKALADPARRRLLDALHDEDGRSLAALCAVVPAMTRFGVMKHLAVLEHAGLVVTHRVGRSKHHYLNPVPIRAVLDRWIGKYATGTVSAMADLAHQLDGA